MFEAGPRRGGAFGDGRRCNWQLGRGPSLGRRKLMQRAAASSAMYPCWTGSFSGVDTLHDYRTRVLDGA
jgi:hypothetical protein